MVMLMVCDSDGSYTSHAHHQERWIRNIMRRGSIDLLKRPHGAISNLPICQL